MDAMMIQVLCAGTLILAQSQQRKSYQMGRTIANITWRSGGRSHPRNLRDLTPPGRPVTR